MLEWLVQFQDVAQRLKKQDIDVVKLLWAQLPGSPRSDFTMEAEA